MTKRVAILLPLETRRVLDKVASRGNRNISDAILHYVAARSKASLAERLKQGRSANADQDLQIAKEWFSVDEKPLRPTKSQPSTK